MERCLRNALKAAAPVGSTSAWAEVTASGAGRLYAEQNFVRSAALGCIKVPSGASKSEIPAKEHRLYLERSCGLPESPATADTGIVTGLPVPRGLNSQRAFGSSAEHRRKSRPRSAGFHGSWPCKRHRISSLRLVRLPPSRPPTKSGARAGGRQLSDRRLHRCVPGTSTSAASSHGGGRPAGS